MAVYATWTGDFAAAESLIAELDTVIEATGVRIAPFATVLLSAFRGRELEASAQLRTMLDEVARRGQGVGVTWARWASGILLNGLGRYEEALVEARQAADEMPELYFSCWALPEVVEAAVRSDDPGVAAVYLARLQETARAAGTDWALGVEARSRALLCNGPSADRLYREAIERLGRTQLRPELARAHLVYGEWLRRAGRRLDARDHLRAAHDLLDAIGMDAFAERARRELTATGEKARRRTAESRDELTPQEEQIARLARDGLSNPGIAAMLFLSPRTVEWHLRKVFVKLGIKSRSELRTVLPSGDQRIATTA
jgi:DNA-binding CsgD family transcriptional regulator